MSLKHFRIEQLCPSIDTIIIIIIIYFIIIFSRTLRHYVIVNLNVNENHVQYVHSKTDGSPRVTQYTFLELSYRKHKNWKKSLKINVKRHSTSAWNDLSNVREPSVCLPLACRQETLLGISNATNRQ